MHIKTASWFMRPAVTAALGGLVFAVGSPGWAAPEAEAFEVAQVGTPAPDDSTGSADNATELEPVVVTGTRVKGVSPSDSISPIDAFGGPEFERQSTYDLTDGLRAVAPSFNTQRYPISDGTAFVRPANLRNLPPDQTLVLVNGRRRHRSALVNLQVEPFGTVNQGAQAVDFALIPAGAVERIEVLRDGASAQYGSDAIAGVINILLKENSQGLTLNSQYGSTYEGDGNSYRVSANWGLPMGPGGFFNATAEYVNSDPTSRGQPRQDAAVVAAALGPQSVPFGGLGQRWGDPSTEGLRLFGNTEFEASEAVQIYGHGSYADHDYISSFFYRTPVGVAGVTPRGTLFVDSNMDGQPDDVDQSIIDALIAQNRDPDDYLTASGASPSGYVALNPIASRFPGGYTPSFGAKVTDHEVVLGLRGERPSQLRWDVSGRLGQNRIEYILLNSINPSQGRLSPLEFRPGVLEQREDSLNVDLVYPWSGLGLASPLNVAFGGEYRTQTYEIGIGDPASFANSPTGILFGVGSDGFQGDPPGAAGEFGQHVRAAYVDLEAELTNWFRAATALRAEDSNDFDPQFDWKLSGRAQASDWAALRATVSTGFRASTPGQANTLDITTTADASGALVPLGTFPVDSPAARALGATPLDTEESRNYTIGIALGPWDDLTLTVDYYDIAIDDRIALANFSIAPGSAEQMALSDAGVEGANLIESVSYFTNAFDTSVTGVELALIKRTDLGGLGYLSADLRHGYNQQTVDRITSGTIDAERVFDLENQLPQHRSILTLDYQSPLQIDTRLRVSRYGGWQDLTFGEQTDFAAKWLVDLALTMHLRNQFHISVGADNVFNTYPDDERNSVLRFLGATRPVSSPFGINGGSWFLRVGADFL